jgi:hypothetical protein
MAGILVGAGLALASSQALAFCRTTTCAVTKPPPECQRDNNGCFVAGIPLAWEQQCLSFSVHATGSPLVASAILNLPYDGAEGALAMVQRSFGLWPSATCSDNTFPSIAIMSLGPLQCDRREYNSSGPNANAILFRDADWSHDAQAIALTTVVFNSKTGKILDADMEINSGGFPQLSRFDLEYVFTHESGHFYGLDHSSDQNAIMYFMYSIGTAVDPALTPDDVAAICAAYPASRITPACNYEPEKGFATDCGGDVLASCAVIPPAPSTGGRNHGGGGRAGVVAALALLGAGVIHGSRRRRRRSR